MQAPHTALIEYVSDVYACCRRDYALHTLYFRVTSLMLETTVVGWCREAIARVQNAL